MPFRLLDPSPAPAVEESDSTRYGDALSQAESSGQIGIEAQLGVTPVNYWEGQDTPAPVPTGGFQLLSTPEPSGGGFQLVDTLPDDEGLPLFDWARKSYYNFRKGYAAQTLTNQSEKLSTILENPGAFTEHDRRVLYEQLLEQQKGSIKDWAEYTLKAQGIPESERLKRIGKADFNDALKIFAEAPVEVAAEVVASNVFQFVPQIAATVVGSVLGGYPGIMAGAGLTSGGTDYAMELEGALKEAGVNTADPSSVYAALNDPELLRKAKEKARAHGWEVGILDGLTAGLAGKVLSPQFKSKILTEGTNLVNQTIAQMFGGATGEALGSRAQGGEATGGELLLEAVGEVGGGATDVAVAASTGLRGEKGGDTDSDTYYSNFRPAVPEWAGQSRPIAPFTEADVQELKLLELEGKMEQVSEQFGDLKVPTRRFGVEFEVPLMPNKRRNTLVSADVPDYQLVGFLDAVPETTSGERLTHAELFTGPQVRTFGYNKYSGPGSAEALSDTTLNMVALLGKDQRIKLLKEAGYENFSESFPYSEDIGMQLAKLLQPRIVEAEKRLAKVASDTVSNWAKLFLPEDVRVIVGDGTILNTLNGKGKVGMGNVAGWHARVQDKLILFELNTDALLYSMMGQELGQKPTGKVRKQLHGVLAHEFGHTIVGQVFNEVPAGVQNAVIGRYEQLLNDFAKPGMPIREFAEKWYRPEIAEEIINRLNKGTESATTVAEFMTRYDGGANYMLSFDEFIAEQIARVMQGRKDLQDAAGPFWQKVVQELKRFYQKVVKRFSPNETIEDFVDYVLTKKKLADLRKEQEEFRKKYDRAVEVSDRISETVAKAMKLPGLPNVPPPGSVNAPSGSGWSPSELKADLDKYNVGIKYTLTLTQLTKINEHIPELKRYTETVRRWWNTKLTWTARADERLKEWQNLSRKQANDFAQFLFEVTLKSDEEKRSLTPDELNTLATKWNLTDDMFSLYDGISQDMGAVVDTLQRVLEAQLNRLHVGNPDALLNALAELQQEMDTLRNRDYFPLSRFGNYTVTVRAKRATTFKGKTYAIGETISFEQREFKREAKRRVAELKKNYASDSVEVLQGVLPPQAFAFYGMPPQLIKGVENILGTDTEAMQEFQELMYKISPAQNFKKHLLERKGTPGFDKNAMRAYADYFAKFGNHIARIEFNAPLRDTIQELQDSAERIRQSGRDSIPRGQMVHHLEDHFNYIMSPQNEWANLRSIGFQWYLGFNPKSAAVNLTQIPLVTYPWLAHRHGDAATVAELTKAYKAAYQSIRDSASIEAELREAVSRGIADGFLDESLATELAATAEGSVLQRYTGGTPLGWDEAQRWIRTGGYYGAWMFQQAEKVNRRVAFIAAFRLAKKKGLGNPQAYEHARDAVESTQYEYARWNRAKFMRGRRSIVFLFWQYLQNTLFFAFGGDKGAARFWLMMLTVAGIQGLPGSDDLLKMATFAARKFGWTEKDLQQDIRGMIQELGVNPDIAMHGLSRYAFGAPQVFAGESPAGLPSWVGQDEEAFRGFDLSGSTSMGRVVPAVPDAMVAATQGKDARDMWFDVQADAGGAFLSLPMNLFLAMTDDHPDAYKRWERMLPSAVKGAVRAFKYATEGKAESRSGATLKEFDINDPYDAALVIGQALGFRPGDIAREQDKSWAARSTGAYWETRRRMIFADYYWAWSHNDTEGMKATLDAWVKYNKQAPYRELKISRSDLSQSVKQRRTGAMKEEKGIPRSNRNRGIQEEVFELYP